MAPSLEAQTSRTALPPHPTTTVPSSTVHTQGDFELRSPPFQTNKAYSAPSYYGNWVFNSGTGIAGEDSNQANPNSLNGGHFVAYIIGTSSFEVVEDFPVSGTYRLRYDMARLAANPNDNYVRITVGGVVVAEDEDITSSYESYVSRPFTVHTPLSQTLTFMGIGDSTSTVLVDNVVVERVRDWDDSSTWTPSGTPNDLDSVTIPAGSVVSITGTCEAATVDVHGELIVPDADGSLSSNLVRVIDPGARFEVGRARAPYLNDFAIELTGDYDPGTDTNAAYKALMAMTEGVIELHGKPKTSWTTLVATGLNSPPGDRYIVVEDFDGWQYGDDIVIAGSLGQTRGYVERNEVHTIKHMQLLYNPETMEYTETRFVLEDDFQHEHFAGAPLQRTFGGLQPLELDQRAEVGMLTHNIVVRGSDVTAPAGTYADPNTAGFGGHIMMMSTGLMNSPGRARFSNVELTKLGQSGVLGRYPFHWHMARDDGAGQYIRNSSIHNTFNRAITIHGTDNTIVEGNVCYSNLGHAVFMEDGSEMDNVLRGNLTMSTKRPAVSSTRPVIDDETIPSDNELNEFRNRTPAAYWITNPNNTIEGNVAAGTEGTGFWLIFSEFVTGLSADPNHLHNATYQPYLQPLGIFKDNVAHGCFMGLDVHDGLRADGTIRKNFDWRPPNPPAVLEDLTIYGCDTAIYTGIGHGTVQFKGARMADNAQNMWFASYDEVRESMIIADTGNALLALNAMGNPTNSEAYRMYDGAGRVVDSLLEGFVSPHSLIKHNRAATRHPNHYFEGVTIPLGHDTSWRDFYCHFTGQSLDNCPPGDEDGDEANCGGPEDHPTDTETWGLVVDDVDGTLTGMMSRRSIISHAPMLVVGGEPSYGTNAFHTHRRYGLFRIEFPASAPPIGDPPGKVAATRFTRTHPDPLIPDQAFCSRKLDARFQEMLTIVNDDFTYEVEVTPDSETQISQSPTLTEMALIFEDNDPGDVTDIEVKGVDDISGSALLTVTCSTGITQEFSLSALQAATTTSYFYDYSFDPMTMSFVGSGTLYVRNVQVTGITDPVTGAINPNKEDRIDVNW